MKKLLGVFNAPSPHWVGDGFPVRSVFSYARHSQHISPFLLLVGVTQLMGGCKLDWSNRPG